MKHNIYRAIVPRETFAAAGQIYLNNSNRISSYIDQLIWWNDRVNLISRNVSRETIADHVKHSLLLSQFNVFENAEFIVDSGCGGGLPGLPLAIGYPQKRFLLNDIVSKKILAIKQICKQLELDNVSFFVKSIANLDKEGPYLLISKHAFKVNELYKMTINLPWTHLVFYKGTTFKNELSGINETLSIEVLDLSPNSGSDFYKDKALLIISR